MLQNQNKCEKNVFDFMSISNYNVIDGVEIMHFVSKNHPSNWKDL